MHICCIELEDEKDIMLQKQLKGSYTVEAAIYVPIILFVLVQSLEIGIEFWQESREREINIFLQEVDVVKEFYGYQIMREVMEEMEND